MRTGHTWKNWLTEQNQAAAAASAAAAGGAAEGWPGSEFLDN